MGNVFLNKDEVDAVVVSCREDQQIVSGPISEGPGQGAGVGYRDALEFEEVDLQKPLLVGNELHALDWLERSLRRDAQILGSLSNPRLRVLPQPGKERRHRVRIGELLNILPGKVVIELHPSSIPPMVMRLPQAAFQR